jgi:hypothetical protein
MGSVAVKVRSGLWRVVCGSWALHDCGCLVDDLGLASLEAKRPVYSWVVLLVSFADIPMVIGSFVLSRGVTPC